jgi:predicted O-methyltransferase YrrM
MQTQADSAATQRISTLDTSVFESIPSESSENDKRSLLACQNAMRNLRSGYGYLEIGSYLGGSIQPHLLDPLCARIVSIDKRPEEMPDNRGLTYKYPQNTTARMTELLREVEPSQLDKLVCIDGESSDLDPAMIDGPIDLCFIDGEHTDRAVLADFHFVKRVLGDSGAVVFHDAQIVYNGLTTIIADLRASGQRFHAYSLPDYMLVIEIGSAPLHQDPRIAAMLVDNHVGYLASLQANDHYRRIANLPPVRLARSVRARIRRTNVSREKTSVKP